MSLSFSVSPVVRARIEKLSSVWSDYYVTYDLARI